MQIITKFHPLLRVLLLSKLSNPLSFLKIEKITNRAVIQYPQIKEHATQEIHNDLTKTLGKEAPSYSTVKKYSASLRMGWGTVEDDRRCGRPPSLTTAKIV